MHRKAEEEAASGANGDDDNVARRRLGPSDAAGPAGAITKTPSRRRNDPARGHPAQGCQDAVPLRRDAEDTTALEIPKSVVHHSIRWNSVLV
jgi:hypothetical protein